MDKELTFDNLEEILQELDKEESETNGRLDELTRRKSKLDSRMVQLETMVPNLDLLLSDSKNVSNMIVFASQLAEDVSGKVRQLDLAKNRVMACIQRVCDILDLKACTDGVQVALNEEDYEKAAAHIRRFLSLDEEVLRMTADANEGSTLDTCFSLLRSAEAKLKSIVRRQFDAAVHANDVASIQRFFKIYPLLGLHDEGLEKFGKHLAASISERFETQWKLAQMSDASRAHVKYADLMTNLFEIIAEFLKTHQPLVETYYGPGRLLTLIRIVQAECDRQTRRVLEQFETARNYERLVTQVGHTAPSASAVGGQTVPGDRLDPKELDALLCEVVILSTRTELYFRFLRRRATADLDVASENLEEYKAKQQKIDQFLNNCYLSRMMQEIIGKYIILEEYFMREMIIKAISMDIVEDGGTTSSMVDDVFFIVKKCINRALSSSSVDGMCAMLNHTYALMEDCYRSVLATRIKAGFPTGWVQDAYTYVQTSFQTASVNKQDAASLTRRQFLTSMNNIEVSVEFIVSLRKTLENQINQLYGHQPAHNKEKLNTCLSDMMTVSAHFRELLDSAFHQLTSGFVKSQVKTLLQPFASLKYTLSDEEFAQYEANDPWLEVFIYNMDQVTATFKSQLTNANFEQLVQVFTQEIVLRLEKLILRKNFSRLGGLQLDREIRSLVSFLSSSATWSVRDKFARVSQIVLLLNVDAVTEVMDYWNSGGMTWRLTPSEVRQFLTLRTDFRTEDIRKLKMM